MKKAIISIVLSSLLVICLAPKASATFEDISTESNSVLVTEYFENPIELEFDVSYAISEQTDIRYDATRSYNSLPSYMWGAYNANDSSSYLQINSGTNIIFRGSTSSYGYVFCSTTPINIYYEPSSSSNNFSLTYSTYYTYSNNNYTYQSGNVYIFGSYNSSSKIFTINGISYYYQ